MEDTATTLEDLQFPVGLTEPPPTVKSLPELNPMGVQHLEKKRKQPQYNIVSGSYRVYKNEAAFFNM